MFQPMACLSNPQVNRLQMGWSSLHAEQHTILLWPCRLLRGSRASRTPDISNNRTCRLSWGRAMIFWPTHTLILLMAESVRIVAIGDLMFFKSQTFTVRSSLPETTLSPTVNTAEVTVSVCPWKTFTEWMEGSLKSQRRKVVSREEVTTSRWVGCVQQWVNSWSCPVREWTSSDVSTSYRFAVLSHEAVTACFPPTSQSAAMTTPWWLLRDVSGTRIVGQSLDTSPSISGSSLSEHSISSSPDICC